MILLKTSFFISFRLIDMKSSFQFNPGSSIADDQSTKEEGNGSGQRQQIDIWIF